MTTTELPTPTEAIALAGQSAHALCASVHDLEAVELDRRTPCPDWDLRTLLVHVADAADALAARVEAGEPVMPPPPGAASADPSAYVGDRVQRLLGVLRAADLDHREWATAAAYGAAIELAAHAWDIATARSRPSPIPDDHARAVLALAERLVVDEDRAPIFGPRVMVGAEADASAALAAFLGRQV